MGSRQNSKLCGFKFNGNFRSHSRYVIWSYFVIDIVRSAVRFYVKWDVLHYVTEQYEPTYPHILEKPKSVEIESYSIKYIKRAFTNST